MREAHAEDFQIPEPLTDEHKKELRECRDNLIDVIKTFFNTKILLRDTNSIKEFTRYLNRFFTSEVQFTIERHGFKHKIEEIMDIIAEGEEET